MPLNAVDREGIHDHFLPNRVMRRILLGIFSCVSLDPLALAVVQYIRCYGRSQSHLSVLPHPENYPKLHNTQINIGSAVLLCYNELSEIGQLTRDNIANGYLLRWYFSIALARRGCPLLKLCHVL